MTERAYKNSLLEEIIISCAVGRSDSEVSTLGVSIVTCASAASATS